MGKGTNRELEEMSKEVERLREIVLAIGYAEFIYERNETMYSDLIEYRMKFERKARIEYEKYLIENDLLYCETCSAIYQKQTSIKSDTCNECVDKQDMVDSGWIDSDYEVFGGDE